MDTMSSYGAVFALGYDPLQQMARVPPLEWTFAGMDGEPNVFASLQLPGIFRRPDQVTVFETPADLALTDLTVFQSFSEFAKWHWAVHAEFIFAFVVADFNAQLSGFFSETLTDSNRIVIQANSTVATHKLALWPPEVIRHFQQVSPGQSPFSQMNTPLVQAIASLPQDADTPQHLLDYLSFIAIHGTHYVQDTFMGGLVRVFLAIDDKYVEKVSLEVTMSFSALFIDIMYINLGIMSSQEHFSANFTQEFVQATKVLVMVDGGVPALILGGQYDLWLETVRLQPAPYNSTFRPYSVLMTDPQKAATFESVSTAYLNGSFPALDLTAVVPKRPCGAAPGAYVEASTVPLPPQVSCNEVWCTFDGSRKASIAPRGILSLAPSGPIPGLSLIGMGVNIQNGLNRASIAGNWSFSRNGTYLNGASMTRLSVPDAVTASTVTEVCEHEDLKLFMSAADVASSLVASTSASLGAGTSLISNNSFASQVAQVAQQLDGFKKGKLSLRRDVLAFSVQFHTALNHSSLEFQHAIAALPSVPSPAYSSLLDRFGTHVAASVTVGGSCEFQAVYDQAALSVLEPDVLHKQLSLMLAQSLRASGVEEDYGFNITFIKGAIKPVVQQNTQLSVECVGGDPSLVTQGLWSDWVVSAYQNPAPLSNTIQLRPLSVFLSDPTRASLLRQAIAARLDRPVPEDSENSSQARRQPPSQYPQQANQGGLPQFIPIIPGVCSHNGGVGVGCSYDASTLTVGAMTINPLQVALKPQDCPAECWISPMPSSCSPYCQFSLLEMKNLTFAVPSGNVVLDPETDVENCYNSVSSTNMHNFTKLVNIHHSSSGFFSSSSTTITNYYHMYFETDSSMSILYKHVGYYRLSAPTTLPGMQTLTEEMQIGLASLPSSYTSPSDKQAYREFLMDFGTHIMTDAVMGGSVLYTSYFHSCMLVQQAYHNYISTHSTGFFIFFQDVSAHGKGYDLNELDFEEWSFNQVNLFGGEASKFGFVGTNGSKLQQQDCQNWEDSILQTGALSPIRYQLTLITEFLEDQNLKSNIHAALRDYIGDIRNENAALMSALIPKDPYCKPEWCKWDPHPFPQPGAPTPPPPTPIGHNGTCTAFPNYPSSDVLARAEQSHRHIRENLRTISTNTILGIHPPIDIEGLRILDSHMDSPVPTPGGMLPGCSSVIPSQDDDGTGANDDVKTSI
jgi:hypothetical protein